MLTHLEKSIVLRISFFGLFLSIIIFSIIFRQGGVLHPESQSFIFNYLDQRPIAQKIFDVQKNDWGFYQGRELSYFFDIIDAYFIKYSVKIGIPHFYSLIFYIGLSLILFVLYLICFRELKFKSFILFGLVLTLLLSAPTVFFSGIFFRTSKILTAVFFTLECYTVIKFLSKRNSRSFLNLLILSTSVSFLGILMSLSDRQGFFLLLSLNLIFLLLTIFRKDVSFFSLFIPMTISTTLSVFYTYFLGPALIFYFTGIKPDLIYLRPDLLTYTRQDPLPEIVNFPEKILIVIQRSILLVIDAVGYFFGNLQPVVVAFFVIVALFTVYKLHKKYFFLFLLAFFLLFIMAFFMLIKQPQMVWPGVRRGGYILSISLVILFFTLFITEKISLVWPKLKIYLVIFLTFALFSNLLNIPYHYSTIKGGIYSDERFIYDYSAKLLKCLKNNHLSSSSFNLPRNIEEICQKLRNL